MDGLTVTAESDSGVIAISSLTDESLENTDNILLTALCDAVNTDMKWDEEHMLEYGHGPVQIKVMQAEIELKTCGKMRIRSIGPEAQTTGEVSTEYENGILKFKLGEENPGMYYLITRE